MATSNEDKKGVVLLGRDVTQIPCYRQSILSGVVGGLFGGLGYFLKTSNARKAPVAGLVCYGVITISVWSACRYSYSQQIGKQIQIQQALKGGSQAGEQGGLQAEGDQLNINTEDV